MAETAVPNTGTTTTSGTTQAIEVTLGDGSKVKGANLDEAFANLSKMKVDTANALQAEKEEKARLAAEIEEIKAENERLKAPPASQPKAEVKTDSKGFDQATYFQLLGQDPIKANRYLWKYDLGLEDEASVPQAFNEMRQQVDTLNQRLDAITQQNVTVGFLANHPEYPQGDQAAAKLLTDKVSELVKQGMPFNQTLVEFAYYQLGDQIKPLEIKEEEKEEDKETPPPSLSGAGASIIDYSEVQKAENMNDKDLLAYLQSKGMFK